MILWLLSKSGAPDDPGSVTPSSHWSIIQTAAPPAVAKYGLSSSKQIFFKSPDGWWIPVAFKGVLPEASQPAYCTLNDAGGISLSSISAKSDAPSLTSRLPPDML